MSSYPHAAKRQTIPAAVALPIVEGYCRRLREQIESMSNQDALSESGVAVQAELAAGLQRRNALAKLVRR